MKMNKASKLAMMYGLAATMSSENDIYSSQHNFSDEDYKRMKKVKQPKQVKKIIPKGLTEFFYGANSIWALNQKNADRKARKKGYL